MSQKKEINEAIRITEKAIKKLEFSTLLNRIGLIWCICMVGVIYANDKELGIHAYILITLAVYFFYSVYKSYEHMFVLKSTLDDLRAMK